MLGSRWIWVKLVMNKALNEVCVGWRRCEMGRTMSCMEQTRLNSRLQPRNFKRGLRTFNSRWFSSLPSQVCFVRVTPPGAELVHVSTWGESRVRVTRLEFKWFAFQNWLLRCFGSRPTCSRIFVTTLCLVLLALLFHVVYALAFQMGTKLNNKSIQHMETIWNFQFIVWQKRRF